MREGLKTAFKVLLTAGATWAAWKGVSKLFGGSENVKSSPTPATTPSTGAVLAQDIASGLGETRDACGKITAVLGALTATADAVNTICGNAPNNNYSSPYMGGGYGNGPVTFGGGRFTMVDPLIITAR